MDDPIKQAAQETWDRVVQRQQLAQADSAIICLAAIASMLCKEPDALKELDKIVRCAQKDSELTAKALDELDAVLRKVR